MREARPRYLSAKGCRRDLTFRTDCCFIVKHQNCMWLLGNISSTKQELRRLLKYVGQKGCKLSGSNADVLITKVLCGRLYVFCFKPMVPLHYYTYTECNLLLMETITVWVPWSAAMLLCSGNFYFSKYYNRERVNRKGKQDWYKMVQSLLTHSPKRLSSYMGRNGLPSRTMLILQPRCWIQSCWNCTGFCLRFISSNLLLGLEALTGSPIRRQMHLIS